MKKLMMFAALFASLTLGACVDNEESASVTAVRNAYAEQLKSVAALNNAKAQAETIKANAEAQLKAAEAALIAAETAYQEALTEEAKAEAAMAKAEAEAYIQKLAAQTELALLRIQNKMLLEEAEYYANLENLDAAEAGYLTSLFDNYSDAQSNLIDVQNDILEAEVMLAQFEAKLISAEDANDVMLALYLEEIAELEAYIAYREQKIEVLEEYQTISVEEAQVAYDEARLAVVEINQILDEIFADQIEAAADEVEANSAINYYAAAYAEPTSKPTLTGCTWAVKNNVFGYEAANAVGNPTWVPLWSTQAAVKSTNKITGDYYEGYYDTMSWTINADNIQALLTKLETAVDKGDANTLAGLQADYDAAVANANKFKPIYDALVAWDAAVAAYELTSAAHTTAAAKTVTDKATMDAAKTVYDTRVAEQTAKAAEIAALASKIATETAEKAALEAKPTLTADEQKQLGDLKASIVETTKNKATAEAAKEVIDANVAVAKAAYDAAKATYDASVKAEAAAKTAMDNAYAVIPTTYSTIEKAWYAAYGTPTVAGTVADVLTMYDATLTNVKGTYDTALKAVDTKKAALDAYKATADTDFIKALKNALKYKAYMDTAIAAYNEASKAECEASVDYDDTDYEKSYYQDVRAAAELVLAGAVDFQAEIDALVEKIVEAEAEINEYEVLIAELPTEQFDPSDPNSYELFYAQAVAQLTAQIEALEIELEVCELAVAEALAALEAAMAE